MKGLIYQLLINSNVLWIRVILSITSYITAFTMFLPEALHSNQYIDDDLLDIIWFTFYSIFSFICSYNLIRNIRNKSLLIFESVFGFVLYSTSTAYSLVTYQFTLSTAPLLVMTILSWFVLLVAIFRK